MTAGMDLAARGLSARALKSARTTIDRIEPPIEAGEVASNRPLLAGRAPPLSQVTIYVNGAAKGTALASARGTWEFQVPAQINGRYEVLARATPTSGQLSITINDPLQPMIGYDGAPALFDMNNAGGVWWADNTLHASAADLLGSLGATVSGVRAVFGGFLDTAAPTEYFSQPAFDSLPTLATGNGFTASVVSGELNVVSAGGGNSYVSYALAGFKGRAFRFRGEGRRGTVAANAPAPAFTLANAQLGGTLTQGAVLGAGTASWTIYGSAPATGSGWYGLRATNPDAGTLYADNWSIQEVMPLPGWADWARGDSAAAQPAWTYVVDSVIPALSGTKVLFQADSTSTSHRLRLSISSGGVLSVTITLNGSTVSTLTLGTFVQDDRVRVAMRCQQGTNALTSGVCASVNGGPRVVDTAATVTLPGISHIRIGEDQAGTSNFDGTYNQVALLRGAAPFDWCEFTARLDDTALVGGGDSYMDGSSGVSLKAALASATGLKVVNIGVGGSTLAAQATTYQSKSYLAGLRFVHWDGSDNGYSSVVTDIASYQAMADAQGGTGKFLFVAPVAVPNPGTASSATPTAQSLRCAQRTAAMVAAFGAAHVFDPLATLQGLSTGSADDLNDVAAGLVPRSQLFDATAGQVHLKSSAMTAVAAAIHASGKIAAL